MVTYFFRWYCTCRLIKNICFRDTLKLCKFCVKICLSLLVRLSIWPGLTGVQLYVVFKLVLGSLGKALFLFFLAMEWRGQVLLNHLPCKYYDYMCNVHH